jgi:tRNA-dihydrouridine synthase 1
MATTAGVDAPTPAPPVPATPANKLKSWDFFASMGSPKFHVAPMVDQSELAFRMLCRRHGATCAYTPMIHARLFVESPKYREEIFTTCAADRPLLVQFCANDPDMLLEAAKMVAPVCDGVDINFGCPQRIAKKGRYGAFLMDDWATIDALIRKLDEELPVPVTAKIRVYDDLETSVKYAQMVEAAGAQLVAVHGRTREQKRAADVRANWAYIAEIKKTLKVPVLANGDVRTLAEARKCLEATGADGVLSADPLLENPSLFSDPPLYEPSDPTDPLPVEGDVNCRMLLEYLELTAEHETPLRMIRGHVHKMVGPWLSEHTDMRDWLNTTNYDQLSRENLARWTEELRGRINLARRSEGRTRPIPKKSERAIKREAEEAAKAAAIAEQEREENAVAGERTTDPRPNRTAFLARVWRLARGVLVFPVRRFFFLPRRGSGWRVMTPTDRDIRLRSAEEIWIGAWRHALRTDAKPRAMRGDRVAGTGRPFSPGYFFFPRARATGV